MLRMVPGLSVLSQWGILLENQRKTHQSHLAPRHLTFPHLPHQEGELGFGEALLARSQATRQLEFTRMVSEFTAHQDQSSGSLCNQTSASPTLSAPSVRAAASVRHPFREKAVNSSTTQPLFQAKVLSSTTPGFQRKLPTNRSQSNTSPLS